MRVALVTGGTRGIGAAISIKLKETGYKVAAVYAGNDEVATKFSQENKVDIFKWSIGNYEECVAGIKRVEEKLVFDFFLEDLIVESKPSNPVSGRRKQYEHWHTSHS